MSMRGIRSGLFFLLLLWAGQCPAQDYKTGLGVRLGGHTSGFSVRGSVGNGGALEGLIGWGHKSFLLTVLYEKFKPVGQAKGLYWFYGGGAHIGHFGRGGTYWIYKNNGNKIYVVEDGDSRWVPGIDFIIGLDYKFNGAPLNLGLDLKPFMDIIDGTELYFEGALSFRFVF
jgi:hypothetical protein